MPPLPFYEDALSRVLAVIPSPMPKRTRELRFAIGATLAQPIHADRDQPPFDRVTMDGYALRAADIAPGARLRVIGEVPAGAEPDIEITPGQAAKVSTGAPLPPGADAVIRHEWTHSGVPGGAGVSGGEVAFTIDAASPGDCVHPQAADARAGQTILQAGALITPLTLAIAAAAGVTRAPIIAGPPIVHVISSGDEIVPSKTPTPNLRPSQIRNSNSEMLQAAIPTFGASLRNSELIPDDPHTTADSVDRALSAADVLVTVGGISAGERDYFPAAFQNAGLQTIIQGAAIQPGRPILIARRPRDGALVVALPGNPVSVLSTMHIFLWPILRHLAGAPPDLPWRPVRLATETPAKPSRALYRPAVETEPGLVQVPQWHGSGDLIHANSTTGLLEIPPASAPIRTNTTLRFLPYPWRPGAQSDLQP